METLTNDQIRERLKTTIDFLNTLNPEQFSYSDFVSESEDDCGTTCCVAGWYPKLYPDSGFAWSFRPGSGTRILLTYVHAPLKNENIASFDNVLRGLIKLHGLNKRVIDALFYGGDIFIGAIEPRDTLGTTSGIDSNLFEVIEFWQFIYEVSLDDTKIEYLK